MKLTGLGKIILLLLVLGAAVGGWRYFQNSQLTSRLPIPGSRQNPATASSTPGQPASPPPNVPAPQGGEVQLVTSASKKGWINDQVEKFNASQGGQSTVTMRFIETREAMHAIIDGKAKPALWSPSSIIWADRLEEVWSQKTGQTILDTSDSSSYKVLLRTPMVFLTTREKAAFLRPLLSSADCWRNIKDLSNGGRRAPWGTLKWAHADPLNANSGMLTLALILADYADRTGQSGSIEQVANSKAFIAYLQALDRRLLYNTAVEKGSSALVASFAEDPSRYDFITAYEASALAEVLKNPNLAVIYPRPTVNAENSIAVLNAPWMSPEQKAGAKEFLHFASSAAAAQDGTKEHFRPAGGGASLSGEIRRYAANGFAQSYSALELPPYAALNAAAFSWRVYVARKPAT